MKLAGAGALGTLGLARARARALARAGARHRALRATPWRRGRRLVDEDGEPLAARDIEEETFYTAYPEGADREQIGAPLVSSGCRWQIREPPGWAPGGIVAYSKICTHAGCAIALYRKPTFAPTRAAAGARLPVPLLDVRPGRRRQGALRPGGPRRCRSCRSRSTGDGQPARGGQLQRPGRPVLVGRADAEGALVIRGLVRFVDQRTRQRAVPAARRCATCFPDHWSFLLGEVALYCFIAARRDRRLPDVLLRRLERADAPTTARTRRSTARR